MLILDMISELESARLGVLQKIEGFHDFLHLGVRIEIQNIIVDLLTQHQSRLSFLEQSLDGLRKLLIQDYPAPLTSLLQGAQIVELNNKRLEIEAAIDAASASFRLPGEAISGVITIHTPTGGS